MAVAKLIGRADEFELVFKQNERGLWETTVPFDDDGVYIIDLLAVDEAGNESRFAKALFTVDATNIHCKFNLQILSLKNKTMETDIRENLSQYGFVLRDNGFGIKDHTSKYRLLVRRCECVI